MGEIRAAPPRVLFFFAVFSRDDALLDELPPLLEARFGPVALTSERFAFTETDYYAKTMGEDLKKQFFVLRDLDAAERLPAFKIATNALEAAVQATGRYDAPRPVNVDPGYVDEAKLVLASTKDHAHRIYLGAGIYAEITLQYKGKAWQPAPWTYPDYRREDVRAFFLVARDYYRQRLREQESER